MDKKKSQDSHALAMAEFKKKRRGERTWSQIDRLANEALVALDQNEIKRTRTLLKAIRGVACSAESDKL